MIYDRKLTIGEISRSCGIAKEPTYDSDTILYPLPAWDVNVWRKRVSDLDELDIVRIIMNSMYLEYTMNEIIDRLKLNPALGYHFDGEVMEVLTDLEDTFWCLNKEYSVQMINSLNKIKNGEFLIPTNEYVSEEDSKDLYNNVSTLIKKLEIIINKVN